MAIVKKTIGQHAAAIILILTAAIFVYLPVLQPGRVLLPADLLLLTPPWAQISQTLDPGFNHVVRPAWDPLFQFYPARKFLAESLSHGSLPLWNPHSFSGTPFAADGQSAIFYPLNWLYAVLPLGFAFAAVAFLHTLLTGLFFYGYGVRVGWSSAGAAAGAIVWMLCGVQVGWQMWQVVDSTLCWLPLCLYFWEGVRRSPNGADGIGLSVSLAMTLLAGHLQFAFYVVLTTVSYALFRPVSLPAWRLRSPIIIAVLAVLACGLSAVQLASTADILRMSIRSSSPIETLLPSALPVNQLGLLTMPELFGGERDYVHHYFVAGDYYEKVVFCGVASLVAALFALRLGRQGDLSRYFVGLALFAVLMGCGSPLYRLFYYVVPLYRSFHGLSRAFVLFDFAVAAMAAQGLTLLSNDDFSGQKRKVQTSGLVAAVFIVAGYRLGILGAGQSIAYLFTHDWLLYGLQQAGTALLSVAVVTAVLLIPRNYAPWLATIVIAVDMLYFASGLNPGSQDNLLYPPTTETSFVSQQMKVGPLDRVLSIGDGISAHAQSRIIPNGAMALGWNDVSGSDPLFLARYDSFIHQLNVADTGAAEPDGQGMIAEATNPGLDSLNVKWIVTPQTLTSPTLRLALSGNVNVYENTATSGPAWLVAPEQLGQSTENIETDESKLLQTVPIYSVANNSFAYLQSIRQIGKVGTVNSVVAMGPGGLAVNVQANSPSLLVLSQIYCPGWTAKVDHFPTKVVPVNDVLTGVFLKSGQHSVLLSYCPVTVQMGLYLTCLCWMVVVAIGLSRCGGGLQLVKPIEKNV